MTENDLHQYQLQAVDHIISHTHCALFLDMGLGKTVSTLTAINELMFKEVVDTPEQIKKIIKEYEEQCKFSSGKN